MKLQHILEMYDASHYYEYGASTCCHVEGGQAIGWVPIRDPGRLQVVGNDLLKIIEHIYHMAVEYDEQEDLRVVRHGHPLIGKKVLNISEGVIVAVVESTDYDDKVYAVVFTQPITAYEAN